MSVVDLQIDEILKLRLTKLMEEFESHRVIKNVSIKKDEVVLDTIIEEIKKEDVVKEVKKEESFFRKFFFSEY